MESLTLSTLKSSAYQFATTLSDVTITQLYGITDGKAVGTYVEQAFNQYLSNRYLYTPGNAASGIDFPELEVDLKVTSRRQPQSSSPFRDASQKIYGLGYNLLIFVYHKIDDNLSQTAQLSIENVVFVERDRTADYQTSYGIREILRRNGNLDDIVAFLEERNLPLDEVGRNMMAQRILTQPPNQGYLTISNALQWRLQYRRVIAIATENSVVGVENLLNEENSR